MWRRVEILFVMALVVCGGGGGEGVVKVVVVKGHHDTLRIPNLVYHLRVVLSAPVVVTWTLIVGKQVLDDPPFTYSALSYYIYKKEKLSSHTYIFF